MQDSSGARFARSISIFLMHEMVVELYAFEQQSYVPAWVEWGGGFILRVAANQQQNLA